ncbi:site-specific integrase [Alicyclobacillus dauci]|uniref:Site-specific integrase n=1 Tax=Alicyclobacillus dauci TaxID=1475485 RepID=A0ABY6Z7S6_9BACL|nr:site-specific integrase [Alicyclobacillus dauci]WAH38844.1 site-specific integrase [Alicyclobacillus dauci]
MGNPTFPELVAGLESELYRLHYNEKSIEYYRRMWRRIGKFLEDEGADHFREELGIRFLDKEYHFSELERTGDLTQSIINAGRVVRMLGDFQQHGSVLRRYYKHRELVQSDELKLTLSDYANHCRQKEYSTVTQNHYRRIAEKFLSFLESQRVFSCSDIQPRHLADYINTLLGYSFKFVELQLCALRSFLRFLHTVGVLTEDLKDSLPALQSRKQQRIPSVWTPEQVTKLLSVIDRGSSAGKRDYAMILLVARLGIRTLDVKHLKLENLKWRDNRIELVQSKTSRMLGLPLLPDVGWAIIDYLKNGRPKVDSPYVFLRHLAPLEPFSDEDRLHQIITKYMKMAKISVSPKKKRGMHSLRHTLATRLLEENTPLSVISDILGHVNSDTTAVYLKVDVDRLRECALDPEAVFE